MSGLQIQQAKYTASIGGKGPPPSLASQQPQSLIYMFTNLVHCTIRTEVLLPRNNNVVYSSTPPTQSGEGTDRSERAGKDRDS